uniref:Amino-acid permease BAT1-like n=1 Tax=Drosophila rhopaloa TaxID=1041015 RepID=A0A6P4FBK9_DRORH
METNNHSDEDAGVLASMGYAQELSRSMKGFSNFAISFSIICILAGGITSFQLGFSSLGGFGVAVGWIVGTIFATIVACSMGQIASAYPTAGGLYHWSSILGGRGWGWATAWVNLLGLIFVLASVNVGAYTLFTQLILGNIFGVDVSGWGYGHQIVGVSLIAASQALFNHVGIRITKILTDFSGYLILFAAVLLTVMMLYCAPGFHWERLLTIVNNTGAAGGDVFPHSDSLIYAFCLSLILPAYTITGFDASAHVAEETIDARNVVPRGMINAVLISGAAIGLISADTATKDKRKTFGEDEASGGVGAVITLGYRQTCRTILTAGVGDDTGDAAISKSITEAILCQFVIVAVKADNDLMLMAEEMYGAREMDVGIVTCIRIFRVKSVEITSCAVLIPEARVTADISGGVIDLGDSQIVIGTALSSHVADIQMPAC